jgi:protein-tyrosine phosphatase
VQGYVDLHCHWVAGIDDGARTPDEGVEMLRALHRAGFDTVVATPHMRPGMFDNAREDLERAYRAMAPHLESAGGVPQVELSSEHYFDDVVFERLMSGQALPYPGGHAVLVEFYGLEFPRTAEKRLFELRCQGILPVIAHPERYRYVWQATGVLERLVDSGAATLLDAASFVGKYGRETQRAAEALLERGLYHAACTDSHRPEDVLDAARGMERIAELYGTEEVDALFRDGPREILAGRQPG